ncbi:MAG: CcdB family protein [Proteobacteria bacterium]|nr:CcdB family protein [Pseudomonadota bacterium]
MARLDVHPMPGGASGGYILDVQADLLSGLATRTVVPLVPERSAPVAIRDLNPIFDIQGERHVMLTQAIATVPARELKRPIASLTQEHDRITRALDILLLGF